MCSGIIYNAFKKKKTNNKNTIKASPLAKGNYLYTDTVLNETGEYLEMLLRNFRFQERSENSSIIINYFPVIQFVFRVVWGLWAV